MKTYDGYTNDGKCSVQLAQAIEGLGNHNVFLVQLAGGGNPVNQASTEYAGIEPGWHVMDFSYRPFKKDSELMGLTEGWRVATAAEVFEATQIIFRITGVVPFAYKHIGEDAKATYYGGWGGSSIVDALAYVQFDAEGEASYGRHLLWEMGGPFSRITTKVLDKAIIR